MRETLVLMRLTKYSFGKEPEFLDEVTRYNNTQNRVAVSDFRSNDPVQRDMAARFGQLKRQAKYFWYKNKRSREQRDRIPVEMEEFTRTIHAFKYGPHDMHGGTRRLFDPGTEGRYARIFGDGVEVWAKVPEDEFWSMAGIWFVCEAVRRIWKEEKQRRPKDQAAGLALERRYTVYFAFGELLRMIYEQKGTDLTTDLKRLGDPKWTERTGPQHKAIEHLTDLAFTGLVKAYTAASGVDSFRHRNWFRDRKYMDGIRSELKFICDITKGSLPTITEESK